ncbi:MAG: hypothetical protein SNJ29_08615 [Rikenellaceae bacterium]
MKTYLEQFSSLKTAKMAGVRAPHKAILLLTVIDLIDWGVIKSNQIELNDDLEWQFKHNWARYVGDSVLFQPKIATPYWHMSGEPFWKLVPHSGGELTKENLQGTPYSLTNLRKQVKSADIDLKLFELLQNEDARAKFRVLLITTYLGDTHLQKGDVLPALIALVASTLSFAS